MTLATTRTYSTVTAINVTIKRPCGKIEVLDVSKNFSSMNDRLFDTIAKQTKAAGKGEALSYEVITEEKTHVYSEEEMAERRYEEGMRVAGFSEFGQSGTY